MGLPPIPAPDTLRIDDLIRSGFEAYRESWFNWLLVSTGLVVVGLLFEAPEIWHESVNAMMALLHSRRPERHASAWVKLAGTVGWILIVVGVSGEFVAESFVSRADGFVQKFDEILLAEAQTKAGSANERAAKNELEAAGLRKEAEQLRQQIQPRTISEADRQNIANKLRQFAPSLKGRKVKIISQIGDGETMLFALELLDILQRAHIPFDPDGMGRTSWVGKVFMGARITGPPSDSAFVLQFARELIALGHGVIGETKPEYKELQIEVGVKPIPGLPKQWLSPHP